MSSNGLYIITVSKAFSNHRLWKDIIPEFAISTKPQSGGLQHQTHQMDPYYNPYGVLQGMSRNGQEPQ
jgi:hypothetical protein